MFYAEFSVYGFASVDASVDVFGYSIFAFNNKKSRDDYIKNHEFNNGHRILRAMSVNRLNRIAGRKFNLHRLSDNFYLIIPMMYKK